MIQLGAPGASSLRRSNHTCVSSVFVDPNQCSSQIDDNRSERRTTSPALRASIVRSSNSLTESSSGSPRKDDSSSFHADLEIADDEPIRSGVPSLTRVSGREVPPG